MQYLVVLCVLIFTNTIYAHQYTSNIHPLSETIKNEMLKKGTYKETCPLDISRLAEVTFSYYDFAGSLHDDGSLIVMDAVAENVSHIMQELYKIKFPINKSQRIEFYDGKDELSMADNNSSSFNCRAVTGKQGIYSIHSYGLAIDINPIQNPFVGELDPMNGKATLLPSAGLNYLNRANIRPGMLEQAVNIFKKYGFSIWGGTWNDPIDWQHFQTSRMAANLLAAMNPVDAREFFKLYAKNPKLFNEIPGDNQQLITLYKRAPAKFMQVLKNNFAALSKMEYTVAIEYFINKST